VVAIQKLRTREEAEIIRTLRSFRQTRESSENVQKGGIFPRGERREERRFKNNN